MELYGTYLSYLIKKKLQTANKALSVRELALLIHIYETRREQYNLERRVRASIIKLLENKIISLEPHRMGQKNIFVTKYKINGGQKSIGQAQGL
ncbi:MAG: hypothetical protein KDC85_18265 [Saprospiraceae bacterium]|nr:hypothetical protein [Saprospiraceae bacterium]MCB9325880.1 hypothetical protein [Lewinellaceae bacterium]